MTLSYTDPVAKLLTYGDTKKETDYKKWPDYLELGLTNNHIPDLTKLATDQDIIETDSYPKAWASLHAMRALGQLRALDAVRPLAKFYGHFEIMSEVDIALQYELKIVFALIGIPAIPIIKGLLAEIKGDEGIIISECLVKIAQEHPDSRNQCIDVLTGKLQQYKQNTKLFNGCRVADLARLKAVGSIDIIRTAYQENRVDLNVLGCLQEAEMEMGI